MKKRFTLLLALGLAGSASLHAQLYITDGRIDLTSVANDGRAVGSPDQNMPFYVWNPMENTYTEIGGISAGNGIGGVARFSADGKLISASMPCDSIPVSTAWGKADYADYANFVFRDISYASDYMLYAVGEDAAGNSGIILRSSNNGVTWKRNDYIVGAAETNNLPEAGIVSCAAAGYSKIFAGGHNGILYMSTGSASWSPVDDHPEGDNTEVDTYTAMDFIPLAPGTYARYGVIGMQLKDGSGAAWYTVDSAKTFKAATGVAGVPVSIAHAGDAFFLVTNNGCIQKSSDHGQTWTTVFTLANGDPFFRIRFANADKGIATTYNVVYITRDGGETWTKTEVLPSVSPWAASVSWNDAVWNDTVLTVVGSAGQNFQSKDDGKSFNPLRIDTKFTGDYTVAFYDRKVFNVLATGGNFYRKSDISSITGYCAGLYNTETAEWTPLESTGYDQQSVTSSAWGISGDGKTVVGLTYNLYQKKNQVQAHAALWNNGGVRDLGSKFADEGRSTRANACSYDGSVVAGWQDKFGPWFASVWEKQTDGTYSQRLLLSDSTMDESDIDVTNQQSMMESLLGYCQAVSADGKWIGGRGSGDTAVPGAWLYNRDTKEVKVLTESDATVSALSNDGTKAVGWYGTGSNAWIWIDGTFYNLQSYAEQKLGVDFGDFAIMSVYDMSANGRYVTGYGMRGMDVYGYVLDLDATANGINQQSAIQVKAAVYPNPVSDVLHVSLPYNAQEVATDLVLYDSAGHCVKAVKAQGVENELSVNGLAEGVYLLKVEAGTSKKTFKVVIRH